MTENSSTGLAGGCLVETSRLLIRRMQAADFPVIARLFCDPVMMTYLGGVWDAETAANALQEWEQDWGVQRRWYGMLVRKDTRELIGTAGITENTLPGEPGFELSWFILADHQQHGFATEITRELARFTFVELGGDRLVAATHPNNPASNRVLQKSGFHCLGEQHIQYEDLPGFTTQVVWELLRGDWH